MYITKKQFYYRTAFLLSDEAMRYFFPKIAPPRINTPRKRTTNTKNNTLAIAAAPLAISVKPKIAATIAIRKKVAAHFNIAFKFKVFGDLNENSMPQLHSLNIFNLHNALQFGVTLALIMMYQIMIIMKTNDHDSLQISLLGFTTFTLKLISSGHINLLKKTLLFINHLFLQSSGEVKQAIIENYLYPVYNFLNDCESRKNIIKLFPFWMQTAYLRSLQKDKPAEEEQVFILHLN